MPTSASIIICTHNRAEHLAATLRAIGQLPIPAHLEMELLVVDNGSVDSTREVVLAAHLAHIPVRYVHAPQRGKGHAYNAGLAAARGDILIFTDDDIRPSESWLGKICEPLISGAAEGVQGAIVIPASHRRPWMTALHLELLAATEPLVGQPIRSLIGANMAFHRRVLKKVPAFDTRLGPGALGFLEDSLFAMQMLEAGYRLTYAADAVVEHHFDASRLDAWSFRQRALRDGRSRGYIAYHWEHADASAAEQRLQAAKRAIVRHYFRHPLQLRKAAVMTEPEFWLYINVGHNEQMVAEGKGARRYDLKGLQPLDISRAAATPAPAPVFSE